jgi:putative addiction module CopG family antidote
MDRQHDEHISLNPAQADFVYHQVESGRFRSPSEVVNEAIRQMQAAEEIDAADFGMTDEDIRRRIEEGAAQADRGELLDGPAVLDELDARHRAQRAKIKRRAS